MKSILFLSNGHGEDTIASTIVKEAINLLPSHNILAAPLVGLGQPYRALEVQMAIPCATMPSGGFVKRNLKALLRDFRAGLLGLIMRQAAALKKAKKDIDIVVAVGDIYPLLMAKLFVRQPIIFLPTAKSDYIAPHLPIEINFMRRWAKIVLPRDEKTAQALRESGVKAKYVGNAMMDALDITGEDFGVEQGRRVVTLLPGSRGEAYNNINYLLEVVELLNKLAPNALEFIVALAPSLDLKRLSQEIEGTQWRVNMYHERPLTADIRSQGFEVKVVQGMFGDCINVADIVIGMAGTGNEQAVGIGKPVVTFPGKGPQFTEAFAQVQKRLLGDAVSALPRDPERVAYEVLSILEDKERYSHMQRVGRERMGQPGAAKRMAQVIAEELEQLQNHQKGEWV